MSDRNAKTKLELTWIGKENRPKLEPRILIEDPERSYHAPHRITDHDLFDNRLTFGDNLCITKGAMAYELRARKSILLNHYPGVFGNRYV